MTKTLEEQAREYAEKIPSCNHDDENNDLYYTVDLVNAYLAGITADRWVKVEADNMPIDREDIWIKFESGATEFGYFDRGKFYNRRDLEFYNQDLITHYSYATAPKIS